VGADLHTAALFVFCCSDGVSVATGAEREARAIATAGCASVPGYQRLSLTGPRLQQTVPKQRCGRAAAAYTDYMPTAGGLLCEVRCYLVWGCLLKPSAGLAVCCKY
jgi:hypothetical protein